MTLSYKRPGRHSSSIHLPVESSSLASQSNTITAYRPFLGQSSRDWQTNLSSWQAHTTAWLTATLVATVTSLYRPTHHGHRLGEGLGGIRPPPCRPKVHNLNWNPVAWYFKCSSVAFTDKVMKNFLVPTAQIAYKNTFNPRGAWKIFDSSTNF